MFPEQLSQQIIENAPEAILYLDSRGLIQHWNAGAERIFGCSATEAIGQSLDLIIPQKLRGRHGSGYAKVMQSGQSPYAGGLLSVLARQRDGQNLSIDFSIIMLRDAQGKVTGSASIMRDMSVQRQKEHELQQRIAELEKS